MEESQEKDQKASKAAEDIKGRVERGRVFREWITGENKFPLDLLENSKFRSEKIIGKDEFETIGRRLEEIRHLVFERGKVGTIGLRKEIDQGELNEEEARGIFVFYGKDLEVLADREQNVRTDPDDASMLFISYHDRKIEAVFNAHFEGRFDLTINFLDPKNPEKFTDTYNILDKELSDMTEEEFDIVDFLFEHSRDTISKETTK